MHNIEGKSHIYIQTYLYLYIKMIRINYIRGLQEKAHTSTVLR